MARKPEPAAPATPVRWTDEEWKAIAEHIVSTRGTNDPAALDVTEIKAKDVFLAQDVLPETRHRKLISIQQGFDASRNRLQAHLSNAPAPAAPAPETEGGSAARSDSPAANSMTRPEEHHGGGHGDARDRNQARSDSAPSGAAGEPAPGNTPDLPSADAREAVTPEEKRPGDQSPASREPGAAANRRNGDAASAMDTGVSHGKSRPAVHGRADSGPRKPERIAEEKRPAPAGADLVEMARPFVAMVCEELANAFVKALGTNAGTSALNAAIGSAPAALAAAVQDGRRHTANGEPGAGRPAAPARAAEREAVDLDDDQHHGETDVQPLFDPKLPPAANSPFRPRIALVASRTDDLSDLQQRFPQLELIPVTLDELRSNPVLRTCQRIVGLREDVPAAPDEYLRRTFGSRYFRANGGVAKVREQLQSWLNNPSTGSADEVRPPRQGGGKGAGAKKRQFRRQRP